MSNSAKGYASAGGRKAVSDSIERMGFSAEVTSSRAIDSIYRIKYELKERPLISIVISPHGGDESLNRCIDSIKKRSTYSNYEIIAMEDTGRDKGSKYSAINKTVREKAAGKYIVLLNGNTEIITASWIEEMLMYAQRSDVGAVGALLYYPDNTVCSAGSILGRGGTAGAAFRGLSWRDIGYMGRLCYSQNLSAVPDDCMMIRKDIWDQMQGMDENYLEALGDADLCMRIRKAGYLIAWTPYAELRCFDTKDRGGRSAEERLTDGDQELFAKIWAEEIEKGDPYYNPNFTLDRNRKDFTLRKDNS